MTNVIWIVADTFRRDHLGAYGNRTIRTPSLDALARKATRFDRHYIAAFPTMPARADHRTGRWTMSFMGWEPIPSDVTTLGQVLGERGYHTAAVSDVPFYWRDGFNYDRGFQTFFPVLGQEGSQTRVQGIGNHEARDVRSWWRVEADQNVARTMTRAGEWLERHYKEDFFLYVDTWDPHEPWDPPRYYTELYAEGYDGEVVQPPYRRWHEVPGMTEDKLRTAHATYCGSVSMVDTWIGYLLRKVENMGLLDKTAVVFTSDHGFYFGEHDGIFGKMLLARRPDGSPYRLGDADSQWDHSPLYEEVAAAPLLISAPGHDAGAFGGLTSAIDVMPTVLDLLDVPVPSWVEGHSLVPALRDPAAHTRDYTISTVPFADVGQRVRSVDGIERPLAAYAPTTVTTSEWALIYSPDPGMSELYHLPSDPGQQHNRIGKDTSVARELHQLLVDFMTERGVPDGLRTARSDLRI